MQQFAGKTAFVTGGASGIGFALGRALAQEGMKVMLADIEVEALAIATQSLSESGFIVRGVHCDVADSLSVECAANKTYEAFGNVHVVCNNAGVGGGTSIDNISLSEWRWVIDVNLMGVVHGIHTFLPHLRAHGERGYIVNTASMAGMQSNIGFSAYSASKYAVVAMSEGLAKQLNPHGKGVSVLLPSFVNTRIGQSQRNRQQKYGAPVVRDPTSADGKLVAYIDNALRSGRDPTYIATRVLDAMRKDDLYVFTHPESNHEVEERFAAIKSAMEKTAGLGP
ncbi:MAG TPA: SDR family NAD(P)-dependent oxidoreductase [Steroidobacteraceae bacterium]|nr:SDR family NAD(P)-dependent oxidoreductase [Steroidobacteraceae bacterium]